MKGNCSKAGSFFQLFDKILFVKANLKNAKHFIKALYCVIINGYPARKLKTIGVTGTDGKTTTATILYQILKADQKKVALISTVGAFVGGRKIKTGLHVTTPGPKIVQSLYRQFVTSNIKYVVVEATSHGLDQHRLLGSNFYMAVLTNITHEHLDYHRTFERYFQAKLKLLKSAKIAVVDKNDRLKRRIIKELSKTEIVSYGKDDFVGEIRSTVFNKFPEEYNRANAMAAITTAKRLGVEKKAIIKGINNFRVIEGRMNIISNNKGIKIVVDFAHTPNALENVLSALKPKKGRLIAVFGCAGERDVQKRPKMANISTKYADLSIFTAEDPRHENTEDIFAAMRKGAKNDKYLEMTERGEAIFHAINKVAKRYDTVAILGKGHEESMSYNGTEYPWSDKKAIRLALNGKVAKIKRK